MPKVEKGQTEGTKGPKNKRKRTEKTRDVGTSSVQAESLSEEVPQMMAPVTLHGNAAPGAPGGLDAAPIPGNALATVACIEGCIPPQLNSVQFSLGHNVNAQIRQKIIQGKYIDLATLLNNSNTDDSASDRVFVMGNDCQLCSRSKSSIKFITIEKWTDAFLVYVSIFTAVHSDKTQDLLKYMHDIRVGAGRSVGWKQYDEQFRLKMAMDPSKSWAVVDSELWVIYMVGPSNSSPVSGFYGVNKCYAFNFQGFCIRNPCSYSHVCIKCGHQHSMLNCPMSAHPRRHVSNFSQRLPRPSGYGSPQRFRQAGPQSLSTTRPAQQFSGYRNLGPRAFTN